MNVFVGIPTHDGRVESGTFKSVESRNHSLMLVVNESSLLAYNCNQLLATALNQKQKFDFKWFAMLHSDVIPEIYWIDKMIDIAEVNEADLLSAVVPIKTDEGFTSTAYKNHGTRNKLHRKDLLDLPEIFGRGDINKRMAIAGQVADEQSLSVNTGCMIFNLQKWNSEIFFKNVDYLFQNSQGKIEASVIPEDWLFSESVSDNGGKIMATTSIKIEHVGKKKYTL